MDSTVETSEPSAPAYEDEMHVDDMYAVNIKSWIPWAVLTARFTYGCILTEHKKSNRYRSRPLSTGKRIEMKKTRAQI